MRSTKDRGKNGRRTSKATGMINKLARAAARMMDTRGGINTQVATQTTTRIKMGVDEYVQRYVLTFFDQ